MRTRDLDNCLPTKFNFSKRTREYLLYKFVTLYLGINYKTKEVAIVQNLSMKYIYIYIFFKLPCLKCETLNCNLEPFTYTTTYFATGHSGKIVITFCPLTF